MTDTTISTPRAGYSNASAGTARAHTLIIIVEDHPGAIDRVVGMLRRKRAAINSLSLVSSEQPEQLRITATVVDTEILVDNLIEQLRKIVDVQSVLNLSKQQTVTRELALIKVDVASGRFTEILEVGEQFGARAVDVSSDMIIFEVVGVPETVASLLQALRAYGIHEVARSGGVSMTRVSDISK